MTFTEAVSAAEDAVVDFYAETVTDGAGAVDFADRVSPASTFFALQPGANTVTFSGCASIDITFRPAWTPGG